MASQAAGQRWMEVGSSGVRSSGRLAGDGAVRALEASKLAFRLASVHGRRAGRRGKSFGRGDWAGRRSAADYADWGLMAPMDTPTAAACGSSAVRPFSLCALHTPAWSSAGLCARAASRRCRRQIVDRHARVAGRAGPRGCCCLAGEMRERHCRAGFGLATRRGPGSTRGQGRPPLWRWSGTDVTALPCDHPASTIALSRA